MLKVERGRSVRQRVVRAYDSFQRAQRELPLDMAGSLPLDPAAKPAKRSMPQ